MRVLLPDFPDVTSSYGAQERKGLIPVLLLIPLALSNSATALHCATALQCNCATLQLCNCATL